MLRYDRIIVFDLETTGLDFYTDRIIEFGAVILEKNPEGNKFLPVKEVNIIVDHGRPITREITNITNITNEMIKEQGVKVEVLHDTLVEYFTPEDVRTLILAYNSQFDLSFVQKSLYRATGVLTSIPHDVLDVLSVYRDSHEYPHKLVNAIQTLGLSSKVVNSHRALDDALATWEVFKGLYVKDLSMGTAKYHIMQYVNCIGYKQKYGLNGIKFPQCKYHSVSNKKYTLIVKHLHSMVPLNREEE